MCNKLFIAVAKEAGALPKTTPKDADISIDHLFPIKVQLVDLGSGTTLGGIYVSDVSVDTSPTLAILSPFQSNTPYTYDDNRKIEVGINWLWQNLEDEALAELMALRLKGKLDLPKGDRIEEYLLWEPFGCVTLYPEGWEKVHREDDSWIESACIVTNPMIPSVWQADETAYKWTFATDDKSSAKYNTFGPLTYGITPTTFSEGNQSWSTGILTQFA